MNKSLGNLQTTNEQLNNLHTIKILLNNLPLNSSNTLNSTYRQTLEDMPQVCVFGAQSSGKSSVLSRMTGIKFPSSSGTCSRIPTHIISRREENDKVIIMLQSVNNPSQTQKIYETTNRSDPSIELSLKKAQSRALELSPNKRFVTDYIILINVSGKFILNSNLVDLPGFNTENETDRNTVEVICKKYLAMSGTIALHICRADVDHNVQAGNDIIKSFPELKKILVITYCDNVLDNRIAEIVNKTLENNLNYKCVAVLGNSTESYMGETEQLQRTLNKFNFPRLHMGTQVLNSEVENMMSIHISKQFPELKKDLSLELKFYKTELSNFNTETPIDIYLKMLQNIEKNMYEQQKDVENKIRNALEDMRAKILNSHIKIDNGIKIYDAITDGPLQQGMIVNLREMKEYKSMFKTTEQFSERNSEKRHNNSGIMPIINTITTGNLDYMTNPNATRKNANKNSTNSANSTSSTSSNNSTKPSNFNNDETNKFIDYGPWRGNDVISSVKNGIIMFENNNKEYHIEKCQIAIKENDKSTVINKIKSIIDENRGLVNTGHTDITPAITYFAEEFAKDYASILGEFVGIINNIVNKYVSDIFNINVENYIMKALNKKKQDFYNEVNENKDKLSERVVELVRSNMGPLIYTSNEHELNLAYNDMIQGKTFDGVNGSLEQIYYRAKAYLICQKSYVIENATKNAMLLLYVDSFNYIKKNMYTNLKEYSDLIEFPQERQLKINELNKYIDTITQILNLL